TEDVAPETQVWIYSYSTTTRSRGDAFKERQDGIGDFAAMCLERKMPGVIKMHLGLRNILFERFRTGRKKERIIFTPYGQQRWLIFPEILLESRIERHVACIIFKEIELHFVGTGTSEVKIVQRAAIRRNDGWIGNAMGVLDSGWFRLQEYAKSMGIRLGCVLPVGANWIPPAAQALFIGVAILADDRRDAVRHLQRDAETDGRAIIKNVNGEFFSSNLFHKPAD